MRHLSHSPFSVLNALTAIAKKTARESFETARESLTLARETDRIAEPKPKERLCKT